MHKVLMNSFNYYFSLNGCSGGLVSFEVGFVADLVDGEEDNATDAKTALTRVMDHYVAPCDRVFCEILDGGREPSMRDTSSSVEAGYEYSGHYPSGLFRLKSDDSKLYSQLTSIFSGISPDMRGERTQYKTHRICLCFEAHKRGNRLHNLSVSIKFSCDHALNTSFYRFTQEGTDIVVESSRDVQSKMVMLDQTLSQCWEQENRDHYRQLTGL